MAKLTLSLGSNEGNRDEHLQVARQALTERLGPVAYTSPVITTPPWGMTAQPDFRNQVIVLSIPDPNRGQPLKNYLHALLDQTQAIELEQGRTRDTHWGPRTLDIDMIFVDDLIYEDDRLSLPHPWWGHRSFVRDLLPPGLLDPYGRILDTR
ncbi:2-amino-4-hydroxy-6-hydroxymethyldihydropteridine diphosphokinase [Lewinella sp. IMCC34191]|uniref:2-amino-4-hydroxy-6- hydroxymethyldihydropteridine diphosphokinase n=1 Tax=Lewinella sp. IMCC34191 TaxID=2259172 RepID=UPI0013004811|nr:2-amino-4-hydroxy-6-hydroxymethyldihydropteridine diphosphokinase [Lewinella sp. IMCC34191]